jgi:predicted RNA-binding Zn ribbon-like protein
MGAGKTALQRARGKPYAETFRCPGGALCLDFCNSGQGAREGQGTEWLSGFGDLVDWLEVAAAVSPRQAARLRQASAASPDAAARAWGRAVGFREALFRVFETTVKGGAAATEDLAAIEKEYARAVSSSRLAWTGERYAWALDPSARATDAALQPLAESALRLLTADELARLRRCANSSCTWLFLDETRNRSRRWCEMASCGNLAKVRRHREKVRIAPH